MPLRNILAISLALMLGQAAWAQSPTGHPEVQYKDAPDFGGPSTGGGGDKYYNCIRLANEAYTYCCAAISIWTDKTVKGCKLQFEQQKAACLIFVVGGD